VKHFSEANWADFVGNLVTPKERMAMQQHIEDGCERCSDALQIWQSFSTITDGENAFAPPADAVRVVKSQFVAIQPAAGSRVRLVFDSMFQPQTAGTRGSVVARQFLYETDEYSIDLRLEPREQADRACLVGQVLHRLGADRNAPGLAVRLQAGARMIAHTSTNEFGEFQLDFVVSDRLCLSLNPDGANPIILPLYESKLSH
jgi:hypothetical protein